MKNKALIVANPHTGILDNIFPLLQISSHSLPVDYDILLDINQLNGLLINSLNLSLSLKWFKTWHIIIFGKIFSVGTKLVALYCAIRKTSVYRIVVDEACPNRLKNKILWLFSKVLGVFSKEADFTGYCFVIGDIYIFTRKDVAPFAEKLNNLTFISIRHGLVPLDNRKYGYIYKIPDDVHYLALTASELNIFDSFGHRLNSSLGLLRHSKAWLDYVIENQSGVQKFGDYILVVSRPSDNIVTEDEMTQYYRKILLFAKSRGLSVVVKPHLWETESVIDQRVESLNEDIQAKCFITGQFHLIPLISQCVFGITFYSGVAADFVALEKVLIQCIDPGKLKKHQDRLKSPYGECICTPGMDFERQAESVLVDPQQYLKNMKMKYEKVVIPPPSYNGKMSLSRESIVVCDFLNKVMTTTKAC